jgi:ADP-ribose pyrophosphatase
MKPTTLTGMETLLNTPWLNVYRMDYQTGDEGNGTLKKGSWLMASRKKLPALSKSFQNIQPDAVICMAFVAVEGQDELKLLVTKEWRHPIQNFEYGFVAGLIDGDEGPVEAARRELKEEAGLTLERVLQVSPPIVSSAGLSDESVQMVFCLASGKLDVEGHEEEEIIEPMLLDYEGVKRLCDRTDEFEGVVIAAKAWPMLYMIRQMGRISTSYMLPPT